VGKDGPGEVLGLDQGEEPGGAGGATRGGRGLGEATMKVKRPGARWEITVDGNPRSYRVDRQIAIESAQYLKRKNPNADVTVRDLTTDGLSSSNGAQKGPEDGSVSQTETQPECGIGREQSSLLQSKKSAKGGPSNESLRKCPKNPGQTGVLSNHVKTGVLSNHVICR
jgi:hypothetical protein